MYYTVIPNSRSKGIGNGLTYEYSEEIPMGSLVRISLRNGMVEGVVVRKIMSAPEEFDIKAIKEVLSETPLLSLSQIETAIAVAEYYMCSSYQALQLWLPGKKWQNLLPEKVTLYKLAKIPEEMRGTRQIAVTEHLRGKDWVTETELREETDCSLATLKTLKQKGVVETKEELLHTTPNPNPNPNPNPPSLTKDQKSAYDNIKKSPHPSLLFGVTGSGKTEVYAQLIVDSLQVGKQAILLVPEILLTEHCIHRFEALLGSRDSIAILHSKLTPSQKRKEWQRIQQGAVQLVIGSRSALFAPCHNLGLVVIDEEHEWTYKNEQTPRYHARTVAEILCRQAGAKLVLGSATPSVESWYKTKEAKEAKEFSLASSASLASSYTLSTLPKRFNNQSLPNTQIVDLADVNFGAFYPFSTTLIDAVKQRLERQEQCVLFLNRRGMATALLCMGCRRRIICPESQLPFTVHHHPDGSPYLIDHSTGITAPVPSACPSCQSNNLRAIGAGTQKIEQLIPRLFPTARVLRADADTLKKPEDIRTVLQTMKNGQADILLGTQSVAKGLDLPNVTLAAVLLADVGLSLPHFRAGERTFQLISQLSGRSGRAKPGQVIIQTYRPDAPEIRLAAEHKTEEYLEQELRLRRHAGYPPCSDMIRLLIRGDKAESRAKKLKEELQKKNEGTSITASSLLFSGGKVWQVLLRGAGLMSEIEGMNLDGVIVDRDPVDTL